MTKKSEKEKSEVTATGLDSELRNLIAKGSTGKFFENKFRVEDPVNEVKVSSMKVEAVWTQWLVLIAFGSLVMALFFLTGSLTGRVVEEGESSNLFAFIALVVGIVVLAFYFFKKK